MRHKGGRAPKQQVRLIISPRPTRDKCALFGDFSSVGEAILYQKWMLVVYFCILNGIIV